MIGSQIRMKIYYLIFTSISIVFHIVPVLGQSEYKKLQNILDSAEHCYDKNQFSSAVELSRKAVRHAEIIGNKKGQVEGYFLLASTLRNQTCYRESLGILKIVNENFKKYLVKDRQMAVNLKNLIGHNCLSLGFDNQAIKEFRESLSIAKGIESDSIKYIMYFRGYLFIKSYFERMGYSDSTKYYLNKAKKILASVPPNEKTIYFYSSARYHINSTGNLDSAMLYNNKGRRLDSIYFTKYQFVGSFQKANILYKKQKFVESLNLCFRLLTIAEKEKQLSYFTNILQLIANNYKGLNDISNQAYYINLYSIKQDSVSSMRKRALESVSDLIVKKEVNKAVEKFFRIRGVLLFTIFLLLALVTISYQKMRKKKRALKEQSSQIFDLGRKVRADSNEKIVELAEKNAPDFLYRFTEKYPEFVNTLLSLNSRLKSSDLVFCAYLKLNFSSKDIANYTFVTHKSVQTRKNRIRKKLNIPSDKDLYLWMNEL